MGEITHKKELAAGDIGYLVGGERVQIVTPFDEGYVVRYGHDDPETGEEYFDSVAG